MLKETNNQTKNLHCACIAYNILLKSLLLSNAIHSLNRYSYGEKINGGFHCRFGVRGENANGPDDITFIKGLEKTGPVSENNMK